MPDFTPNPFNFSLQTRPLCTFAARNPEAYSLDTHRVMRNGMLGRGEDTHERSAHISLAPFSLRPAAPPPIKTLYGGKKESGWSVTLPDASPGIKKSP